MTAVVQRREFLNLQNLRVLQVLVLCLQEPVWPEKAKISREKAFTLIVNLAPSLGVEIGPTSIDQLKQDPNFLPRVALEITQLLLKGQPASIPPHLKARVAEYEKYLAEDQTEQARQTVQTRIEQLLQEANPLLKKKENQLICQDAAAQITEAVESYVPPLSPEEKFSLAKIDEVLEKALPEIEKYLSYAGIKPEFRPQVVKTIHQVITKKSLPQLETIAKAPVSQRIIAPLFPQPDQSTVDNFRQYAETIRSELAASYPELAQNPPLAKKLSQNLAQKAVSALPPTAEKEILSEEKNQQTLNSLQPVFNQELKKAGIEKPVEKTVIKKIGTKTLALAQVLATTPRTVAPTLPSPAVKESVLKILYPQPNKPTLNAHQELESQIETNLKEAFPQLASTPEVAKAVSEQVTNLVVTALPQVARSEAFLPAEIEQLAETIQPAVSEVLEQTGITEPITQKKLVEVVKDSLPAVQKLAATPHLTQPPLSLKTKEATLRILYPRLDETARKTHQQLVDQIKAEITTLHPELAELPVADNLSNQLANTFVTALPQVARSEAFLPAEVEQVLKTIQPAVSEVLGQASIAEPEAAQKKLVEVFKGSLPVVQKLAATPHLVLPPSSSKTKEAVLRTLYPRLDEATRESHEELVKKVRAEITTLHPELAELPVADNLSNQLANTFVATLPQVARRGVFKSEEFQRNLETIRPVIERTLRQAGVEPKISKEKLAEISQRVLPVIQNLVVTPHTSFFPLLPTTKEAALKASFIHYDDKPTQALYPQIEKKVFQSLQTIEALNATPLAHQIVAERVSFALVSQTPSTPKDTTPEQRQILISQAVGQELERIGYKLPPQETTSQIAADIAKQIEPEIATLTTTPRTFISLPEFLESERVSEFSAKTKKIIQAENILAQKISFELRAAKPTLAADPELAQTLSQEIKDVVTVRLFALPQKTITPEEYKELLTTALPEISERLATEGISFRPKQTETLIKKIARASPTEAAVLTSLGAPILPKAVVDQLTKTTDGVAFKPIYTILNPKLTLAYLKKIALTPAKLILDASASQATPEWQEMIREGLFAKDIQASLAALKKAGLSETHPIVAILKEKMLTMVDQDTLAAKILRHYWEYDKLTGQKQIWESDAKLFLPQLSPSPIWSRLTGFPWRLRQTFNELGLKLKIFQKIEIAPGKNVIRFVLPDKIIRFFTFGRFQTFTALKGAVKLKIRQGITTLAKTGLGKAITKGATWVAIKLGLKTAVTAAATGAAAATGPPGWLVAAVVKVISFIGKKILRPIFDKLKQIIKEPEKALGLIGVGVVAMVFLPMPFALIGAIPITLGGLGLISAGVGSAGAIASGFATGVATFFTTLTTVPITAASALLIVGTITALSVATFFIVITTAGAFILPTAPVEEIIVDPGAPPPGEIPVIPRSENFAWPVPSIECSSNFGFRLLSGRCDFHEGIDLPHSSGTEVRTTTPGTIHQIGYNRLYGIYVIVNHGDSFFSIYAHLLNDAVTVGESVTQSTVIGYVGNSGYTTGAHLHFGFSNCAHDVYECFNNGIHTPNPCDYLSGCPASCVTQQCGP